MNCAGFERGLVRLMSDEDRGAARARLLDELRRHLSNCADCRGSADLVDLLALPAGEREIVEDPGEEYWSSFDDRLKTRMGTAPARSRGPWWAVAAAVLLLALLAGWMLRGPGESLEGTVVADAGTGPTTVEAVETEFPAALVQSLDQATAEEVENQLAALEELGPPRWGSGGLDRHEAFRGGGLFPEVERLDTETRERLLDWLRDQNRDLEGAQG